MPKIKAFIDANVWYTASYKSTGHSRQIISGSLVNIQLFTSEQVLSDTRKYLEKKAPNRVNIFEALVKSLGRNLQITSEIPDKLVLESFEMVTDFEDAFVLASARLIKAQYLVTWNVKDFIQEKISDIKIITPKELVKIYGF